MRKKIIGLAILLVVVAAWFGDRPSAQESGSSANPFAGYTIAICYKTPKGDLVNRIGLTAKREAGHSVPGQYDARVRLSHEGGTHFTVTIISYDKIVDTKSYTLAQMTGEFYRSDLLTLTLEEATATPSR